MVRSNNKELLVRLHDYTTMLRFSILLEDLSNFFAKKLNVEEKYFFRSKISISIRITSNQSSNIIKKSRWLKNKPRKTLHRHLRIELINKIVTPF